MIKQRLLQPWSLTRILYVLIGILVMFQSVSEEQWLGLGLGGYMAIMGVFAFGCAGNTCNISPKK